MVIFDNAGIMIAKALVAFTVKFRNKSKNNDIHPDEEHVIIDHLKIYIIFIIIKINSTIVSIAVIFLLR